MSRPLLAVDGDSFAHRAFHALPQDRSAAPTGGPATRSSGFTTMLLRLWQAERPRAVVVGWDTLGLPTYRTRGAARLPGRSRVRPRAARAARPAAGARRATGIVCGKAPGYEADDFLAAAVPRGERGGGRRSSPPPIATRSSSRATATTILQPMRGVSEIAAHRPGRGARALRRRPGAGGGLHRAARRPLRPDPRRARRRREDGRVAARRVRHARRAARRGALRGGGGGACGSTAGSRRSTRPRRCRRSPIASRTGRAGAAAARELGLERARRAARGGGADGARQPPGARAAPSDAHAGIRERAAARGAAGGVRAVRGASPRDARSELERVHDPAYVDRSKRSRRRRWLDGDTVAGPTTWEAARLAAGMRDRGGRRGAASRSSARPGTTRSPDRAMGFCIFGNVAVAARHAQAALGRRAGRDRRLGRPPRQRHRGLFAGDDSVLFVSLHQWPFYPGHRRPRLGRRATTVNIPLPAGSGDAEYRTAFGARSSSRSCAAFDPELLIVVSAGFDAHVDDRSAGCDVTATGSASSPPLRSARPARRRRARGRLQPGDAAGARRGRARRLQRRG